MRIETKADGNEMMMNFVEERIFYDYLELLFVCVV